MPLYFLQKNSSILQKTLHYSMVKLPVPIFVPLDDGMDKYDVVFPKNDKLDII